MNNRGSSRSFRDLPSPWLDLATASMPTGHRDALQWSEYIYEQHPTFRQAQERRISYFLTDIEIASASSDASDLGDDEQEYRKDILCDEMDVMGCVQQLSRERGCYGNGFVSLYEPFQRMLGCSKCGTSHPLEVVGNEPIFRFEYNRKAEFVFTCAQCDHRGPARVTDTPETDPSKFRLHIWNPKEMEIAHDLISGEARYLWRIPQDYRQKILKGSLLELMGANREMLDAIRDNCQLFQFEKDVIFHLKEPTLSGLRNNGWGVSEVFRNYREIWFTQLLRCQIEAFAIDYVIPLRVVTPDVRSSGGGSGGGFSGGRSSDPFMTSNMGSSMGKIAAMLRNKRLDPATWNFIPFPVKSILLGGDANQLIPKELYDQAVESMLNATGTPVELYRGTLKLETAMVGLRLFESTNFSLVHGHNMFLRWLSRRMSARLGWSPMRLTMKRVTYADDFNSTMLAAQLMMQGKLSEKTTYDGMGINSKNERRLIAEETRDSIQQQSEIQKEMEQSAFGQQVASGMLPGAAPPGGQPGQPGAAPPGGQPAAGGQPGALPAQTSMVPDPNTPMSPMDAKAWAEQKAQELFGMPESQKDSELRQLAQKNELLHLQTREALDRLRNQTRMAGGEMLRQQGGAAPPGG